MGNICRSPTGECVFRHYVENRGMENEFEIDSAGTIAYHVGEPPDERMREAAEARGIEIDGVGRQFKPDDFDRFDLIVAMDRDNLHDILRQDPRGKHHGKVRLLCDFIPGSTVKDVPDPYYGGRQGFERVLDMIQEACPGILGVFQNGRAENG